MDATNIVPEFLIDIEDNDNPSDGYIEGGL